MPPPAKWEQAENVNPPHLQVKQACHCQAAVDKAVKKYLAFQSSTHFGPIMMFNMGTHLSPFNIGRVLVTFACLILFFLQSRRVIEKFFSNMTSTSTRYMSGKEADIRLPRIAICAKESFKSDKFPETLDEYLNLTYSQDELIGGIMDEEDYNKVTEIATIFYGRCYVLEMPRSRTIIGLNTTKEVLVYFIDQGQELCIINSMKTCDEQIQSIVVNNFYHDSKIAANKLVREKRYSM